MASSSASSQPSATPRFSLMSSRRPPLATWSPAPLTASSAARKRRSRRRTAIWR
ncbi:hypothetical protein ACFPRL_23480 [Pseudoclavibacter helvolus]